MHKFILLVLISISYVCFTKAQVVGGQGRVESNQPVKKSIESSIFNNGVFADVMIQGGPFSYSTPSLPPIETGTFGLNARFGNKWYFGNMNRYRPGFTATWLRSFIIIGGDDGYGEPNVILGLSALNVGLTNIVSFNQDMGVEFNVNFGGAIFIDIGGAEAFPAFLFNPNIKFRYKQLAVGLDICYSVGELLDYSIPIVGRSLQIGLTIGRKLDWKKP